MMPPKPILTPQQVAEIRAMKAADPKLSNKAIAAQLGVGETTIKVAVRGMNQAASASATPAATLPAGGDADADRPIDIEIDRIFIGDLNPRKSIDESEIVKLAELIRQQGLLQNLVVRAANEHDAHELVAGERRLRALRLLRREGHWNKPVPCRVVHVDNAGHLALALMENIAREDVSPLDEADAFARLHDMDKETWTTAEIAQRIGKTQRYVQQRIALSRNLGPEARAAVADKSLPLEAARMLCRLPFPQQALFFEQHEEPLTVDDVHDFILECENVFFVENALFDIGSSGLETENFRGSAVFCDSKAAFDRQMVEIESRKAKYLEEGYAFVTILPVGEGFPPGTYRVERIKSNGAGVIVRIDNDGEVYFHVGYAEYKPPAPKPSAPELPLAHPPKPELPMPPAPKPEMDYREASPTSPDADEPAQEAAEIEPARELEPTPELRQPDAVHAPPKAAESPQITPTPDPISAPATAEAPGAALLDTFYERQKHRHLRVLLYRPGDYRTDEEVELTCETCKDFELLQHPGGVMGFGVCLNPVSNRAGMMTGRRQAGRLCHSSLAAAKVDAAL